MGIEIIITLLVLLVGLVLVGSGYSFFKFIFPILVFVFALVFADAFFTAINVPETFRLYVTILAAAIVSAVSFIIWRAGSAFVVFGVSYLLVNLLFSAIGIENPGVIGIIAAAAAISFLLAGFFRNLWKTMLIVLTSVTGSLLVVIALTSLTTQNYSLNNFNAVLTPNFAGVTSLGGIVLLAIFFILVTFGTLRQMNKRS